MVVSIIALVFAVAGTAVASVATISVLSKKEKKQTRNIANSEIDKRAPGLSVASANTANTATNATQLGGVAASGYQGFCKAGAIKGTLVVSTLNFTSSTYQNVTGFNCFQPGNTTTSVQMRKLFDGQYLVRFVGNTGPDASGSAVASLVTPVGSLGVYPTSTTDAQAPGETVFLVRVLDNGSSGVNNQTFSLLAF
jgi:hypothetical protein